jgi:hypothetical protein
MKVLGADPGPVFAPPAAPSQPLARRGNAEFAALLGARTPLGPDQARAHLSAAWRKVTGSPAPARALALLQAQWALETGAGAAMYGNNFGGLKALDGGVRLRTREGHGANAVSIVDRFRTYASADAGAADYVELLARRYPDALEAAHDGDVTRFGSALANGGYYTASETSYTAGLERWRAHFQDGAPPPAGDPCIELAREGVLRALEWAAQD